MKLMITLLPKSLDRAQLLENGRVAQHVDVFSLRYSIPSDQDCLLNMQGKQVLSFVVAM